MSDLTIEQRLAACALDVVTFPSEAYVERARAAAPGQHSARVTIPWPLFLALADALEAAYPGAQDAVRASRGES